MKQFSPLALFLLCLSSFLAATTTAFDVDKCNDCVARGCGYCTKKGLSSHYEANVCMCDLHKYNYGNFCNDISVITDGQDYGANKYNRYGYNNYNNNNNYYNNNNNNNNNNYNNNNNEDEDGNYNNNNNGDDDANYNNNNNGDEDGNYNANNYNNYNNNYNNYNNGNNNGNQQQPAWYNSKFGFETAKMNTHFGCYAHAEPELTWGIVGTLGGILAFVVVWHAGRCCWRHFPYKWSHGSVGDSSLLIEPPLCSC